MRTKKILDGTILASYVCKVCAMWPHTTHQKIFQNQSPTWNTGNLAKLSNLRINKIRFLLQF